MISTRINPCPLLFIFYTPNIPTPLPMIKNQSCADTVVIRTSNHGVEPISFPRYLNKKRTNSNKTRMLRNLFGTFPYRFFKGFHEPTFFTSLVNLKLKQLGVIWGKLHGCLVTIAMFTCKTYPFHLGF